MERKLAKYQKPTLAQIEIESEMAYMWASIPEPGGIKSVITELIG